MQLIKSDHQTDVTVNSMQNALFCGTEMGFITVVL